MYIFPRNGPILGQSWICSAFNYSAVTVSSRSNHRKAPMIVLSDAQDDVMNTNAFKNLIVELVRGGCEVERLAYDPPLIVFRNPGGIRCALTRVDNHMHLTLRDDQDLAVDTAPATIRHLTMHQAIQAACAA